MLDKLFKLFNEQGQELKSVLDHSYFDDNNIIIQTVNNKSRIYWFVDNDNEYLVSYHYHFDISRTDQILANCYFYYNNKKGETNLITKRKMFYRNDWLLIYHIAQINMIGKHLYQSAKNNHISNLESVFIEMLSTMKQFYLEGN